MESLSEILSGATAPAKTEAPANTPPAEKAAPATGEKPAEAEKPAASAPPAEKARPDEAKPDDKAGEKPAESEAKPGEQPRDDKGKFAKPESKEPESKENGEETVAGLRNALHAARKQKQEADRRAKEAEERANAAQPKEAKPKKDFWEDPEGAVAAQISEAQRDADARFFNLCEELVKREHTDYEEIIGELMEETDADAALAQQVFTAARASKNPAEHLYKTAKNRREMKAIGGDLGKYKESIAEPFKATIAEKDKALADKERQLSEAQGQIKSLQTQLDKLGKVPASLNSEPSASRASVELESTEPPSLATIVEPKKRRA